MTFPFGREDAYTPILLRDLIKVLEPLSGDITLISGEMPGDMLGKATLWNLGRPSGWRRHFQVPPQIQMAVRLLQASRKYDVVLFWMMLRYPLPVLVARLLGKRTLQFITGAPSRNVRAPYGGKLLGIKRRANSLLLGAEERLSCLLAHQIVVESEGVINWFGLGKLRRKVMAAGALPIDLALFEARRPYASRDTIVGYIGRLAPVKGVMNLVRAIPLILKERGDVRFLIGGDGPLREEIERYLNTSRVRDRVEITGWLPPEDFADRLNQLKLFVLPSYSEGLPVTPLQAMACGTPVLATPVGGVPDIIKDGETGFLIRDNSYEGVARDVLKALNFPRLDDIARRVRPVVVEGYSFEVAVKRFQKVLCGEVDKEK